MPLAIGILPFVGGIPSGIMRRANSIAIRLGELDFETLRSGRGNLIRMIGVPAGIRSPNPRDYETCLKASMKL